MLKHKDIRDVFFDNLYKQIQFDKKIILLTVDQGAFGLDKIKNKFPKNYINIGISEQNIFNVSIGLAKNGFKPYVYLISPFIMRAIEQIKIGLSSMKSKIVIIGSGYAHTYASDGPTHYFTEDYGIIRCLPNINFYSISDPNSAKNIFQKSYKSKNPSYIRLDKGLRFNYKNYNKNGVSHILNGKKKVFISSSYITHKLFQMIKNKNKSYGLIDITQLIPFDFKQFKKLISKYEEVIFVEENSEMASLAVDIYYSISKNNKFKNKFKFIHTPNEHFKRAGNRDYILEKSKIFSKILKVF